MTAPQRRRGYRCEFFFSKVKTSAVVLFCSLNSLGQNYPSRPLGLVMKLCHRRLQEEDEGARGVGYSKWGGGDIDGSAGDGRIVSG
ncbi:hypothetical protein ACFX1X_005644 [Malus domestica]